MLVLDVNVLLAAFRQDHPHHGGVRQWFDAVLLGDEDFGVPPAVWVSFVRLVTHRRVFAVPATTAEAFGFVEATVAQARYVPVGPGPRHLALLRRLCEESEATGDVVADAALGAVALEVGGAVATLDRDFARFPSVRTVLPSPPGGPAAGGTMGG